MKASLSEPIARLEAAGAPPLGVILGSGLDGVVDDMAVEEIIDYTAIDGMIATSAPGHAGRLILGQLEGRAVAVCSGRLHLYEGHSALDAAMTVYLLYTLGVRSLFITNAAGALNPDFQPGDMMVIDDHINFTGRDPLLGDDNPQIGPRFTDMSRAYCPDRRALVLKLAQQEKLALHRGIYAGVLGPSLETSAERRFYRMAGCDAIGMSTVMEVIAANHCAMKVTAISAITNMATGGAEQQPDTIEEVLENAAIGGKKITVLLKALIANL